MFTHPKILHKLEHIERRYSEKRYESVTDVSVELWQTKEFLHAEPGRKSGAKWKPAKPGMRWGGSWVTGWFRGDVRLPAACRNQRVFVRAKTGAKEAMFLVDGEHRGTFDYAHPVVMMTGKGSTHKRYHLAFEAYARHDFPGTQPDEKPTVVERNSALFEGIEIVLERDDVSAFVFDLKTLRQLATAMDENSLRRGKITRCLAKVFEIVDADPNFRDESSWRPKLAEARKVMKPLLALQNGPTTPQYGIMGHSHLDTAWLWTIAETERKTGRTFGSVLNLMEQFPKFKFLQSSPCHVDMVKRLYPDLFKRIQKAVKAGRWEPNGGAWVEPDCNLTGGEALIRHFLLGQLYTREHFDYTADTFWQPDVFGYSAALPQILQGVEMPYFCTTKIGWNDTTRFPYDTFVWEGIDGSKVLAHFNTTHWVPDPASMIRDWNWVQHKDVQDRRFGALGWGDGGGGPTEEMLHLADRLEDLEGCPKAEYTTLSDFMKGVDRDLSADLPKWVGELYLELHRGTLTGIAAIKRLNRENELALRDAEWLATVAALRGGTYPSERMLELWKVLLINQFHDILPGSSIAEANDQAIKELNENLTDVEELAGASAKRLAGSPRGRSKTALIFNSLSWDRVGQMELRDAPRNMVPDGPEVTSQWVEDVEGKRRLMTHGLEIAALGASIVPLKRTLRKQPASPFISSKSRLETPHYVVRFDRLGRIVSLKHKASNREVVQPGGALNTFWIGEDVPQAWDNWDIDSDQKLKMRAAEKLVSREVVADGPLQIRIRSKFEMGGASTLTQDVVFHAHSERVDFDTVVDWQEKMTLLKAGFELNLLADQARHEIQYGHVDRPTHLNQLADRARFEVCAHKWTDLSENGFGVALLNNCKYGVSVEGSDVRLTLIKSGTHPDPRGDPGRHRFSYALLPHDAGFGVESVIRPAYEFNVQPRAIAAATIARPIESLVRVDQPNIIIESVKWAEKGKAFVVRLYDAGRIGRHVQLTFGAAVKRLTKTNMLEVKGEAIALRDGVAKLYVKPFEIVTLRCEV